MHCTIKLAKQCCWLELSSNSIFIYTHDINIRIPWWFLQPYYIIIIIIIIIVIIIIIIIIIIFITFVCLQKATRH